MVGSSIVLVRRVLAAVATLALGLGVAPAAGADTSAPSGSGPREFVATTPPFGSGGTRPLGAADVFVPPLSCPSGFVYGAMLRGWDFEDGLGVGIDWGLLQHTSFGPLGRWYASVETSYFGTMRMTFPAVRVSPRSMLVIRFAHQGAAPIGTLSVVSNGASALVPDDADWRYRHYFDDLYLSSSTGGMVTVEFLYGGAGREQTAGVDDVLLYECKRAPVSGVRGDLVGRGQVSLLGAVAGGDVLLAYDLMTTGALPTALTGVYVVGAGWNMYDWIGSPGDLNADRRSDLLARKPDGSLSFYPGMGGGSFRAPTVVGTGWGAMTAVTAPGDVDLDGRPDLLARRSDGTLHLYRILTTGALRYVKQVGTGWNGMTWIVGMGDLSGDGRGDVVAIRYDGAMFAYQSRSDGTLGSARYVGGGWGPMVSVVSPGDVNKDGLGDLYGYTPTGDLYFYAGKSIGVRSGVKVSSPKVPFWADVESLR